MAEVAALQGVRQSGHNLFSHIMFILIVPHLKYNLAVPDKIILHSIIPHCVLLRNKFHFEMNEEMSKACGFPAAVGFCYTDVSSDTVYREYYL